MMPMDLMAILILPSSPISIQSSSPFQVLSARGHWGRCRGAGLTVQGWWFWKDSLLQGQNDFLWQITK